MLSIKVPIINIIIGEGASGGALGIGIGDRILMLENTGILSFLLNLVHLFYGEVGSIKKKLQNR